jgi:hypothetical protein
MTWTVVQSSGPAPIGNKKDTQELPFTANYSFFLIANENN